MDIKNDAYTIINESILKVLPDEAVYKALKDKTFDDGRIYLIAIGKAAFQMTKAASDILNDKLYKGIVITKYNHIKGTINNIECYEAGHPIPDENAFIATKKAISLVNNLNKNDTVIFLISGGGSALFEDPLVSKDELEDITNQLLKCGADINEINTIRKRLSKVKGGKFANICKPAKIYSIVLSDIIKDPLDMIASGPAYPDSTTCIDAMNIVNKYNLNISDDVRRCLNIETVKQIDNVETVVTGSVKNLCIEAKKICERLGYQTIILTDELNCFAKDAGYKLGNIAIDNQDTKKSLAFIMGGETVVEVKGNGLGGRNQELALSSALLIKDCIDTCIFSIGSDGTDGPTDAAGGYVDNQTYDILKEKGISINDILENNDSYNCLKMCDGLIFTGPTGTNVNDISILLIKR